MISKAQGIQGFPSEQPYGVVFLTTPVRYVDTRLVVPSSAACIANAGPTGDNTEYRYTPIGSCTKLPVEAKGIFGNLYFLNHAASGYALMYPDTSLIRKNYAVTPPVTNRPIIATTFFNLVVPVVESYFSCALGENGAFWLYVSLYTDPTKTTDYIIDIVGYYV